MRDTEPDVAGRDGAEQDETGTGDARPGRRIGRRGMVAIAGAAALLIAAGIVVAGSGGEDSAASGASTSVATTVIKRQDLV